MIRSEEQDLREGLVYDVAVKAFDSSFWKGDTANLTVDTVKNTIKIGDTGIVGGMSSYSQYLYGDFEFTVNHDTLSPDSNDSEKYFGLRNLGDTLNRGAVFFNLSYDTTAGDSSAAARPFSVVMFDEYGNRQRKAITWSATWDTTNARFRIRWEEGGYTFLINDTIYATLGDRPDGQTAVNQINTSIPQALRLSNRSLDTSDTNPTAVKLVNIRHARKII